MDTNKKHQRNLYIGKRKIGDGQPVFIIAEAGVNHNGSVQMAEKLIDVAKRAGADAVKFQTFSAEELVTPSGEMAEYQKKNTGKIETQFEMLRKLALTEKDFKRLSEYAKKKSIVFLSTPHGGFASVDILSRLHVPAYKFGSADTNNFPVLSYAARMKKPMIISSGMSSLQEIREAVECIQKTGNKKIIVFQCTTDYPVKLEDVNLRAMSTMQNTFKNVLVGYSDHTPGSQASVMAVTLGARILEKHLTLDNNLPGPDHKASENPDDFTAYVQAIRNVEVILGSSKKTVVPASKQYIPLVFKSLVACAPIKKGEKFTSKNVAIKRPAKGLPPKFYSVVLGTKAKRDIPVHDFIKKGDYGA